MEGTFIYWIGILTQETLNFVEVIMAFDFKKEYKEFYMPKNKPEIVDVPKANYIAVRGKGNPNEEGWCQNINSTSQNENSL